jgi:transcription elongation factor
MCVRIEDTVRVLRGEFQGTVGVVEDVGTKFIGIRAVGADGWPFGRAITVDRHDLLVVDRNDDVEEALL